MPIVLEVSRELEPRVLAEAEASGREPVAVLEAALDRCLEDWEDIREAARVLAEVEAGRMETHPWEEVRARLGLDG